MKKIISILFLALMLTALTACGCKHQWQDAACTTPKTCTLCGVTEGEPLGHTWVDATCTAPRTCSVCNTTDGEPLPHTLTPANYQDAPLCTVCGTQQGEPLTPRFEEVGLETITLPLTAPGEWSYTGEVPAYCLHSDQALTCQVKLAAYPVDSLQLSLPDQSADITFCELFDIEPIDGYAVYCCEMELTVTDANAYRNGVSTRRAYEDYYTIELNDNTSEWKDSVSFQGKEYNLRSNTISYHGEEKMNYQIVVSTWSKWTGITVVNSAYIYVYQPSDYAGNIFSLYHTPDKNQEWEDGMYIYDIADEYSAFFRIDPNA